MWPNAYFGGRTARALLRTAILIQERGTDVIKHYVVFLGVIALFAGCGAVPPEGCTRDRRGP